MIFRSCFSSLPGARTSVKKLGRMEQSQFACCALSKALCKREVASCPKKLAQYHNDANDQGQVTWRLRLVGLDVESTTPLCSAAHVTNKNMRGSERTRRLQALPLVCLGSLSCCAAAAAAASGQINIFKRSLCSTYAFRRLKAYNNDYSAFSGEVERACNGECSSRPDRRSSA